MIMLVTVLVAFGSLSAQIVEDDIYFNPRTDKQQEQRVKEQKRQAYRQQYEEKIVEVVPEIEEFPASNRGGLHLYGAHLSLPQQRQVRCSHCRPQLCGCLLCGCRQLQCLSRPLLC